MQKRRSLATQLKAMLHERAEQESKLKITLQQVQEHKEALLQVTPGHCNRQFMPVHKMVECQPHPQEIGESLLQVS